MLARARAALAVAAVGLLASIGASSASAAAAKPGWKLVAVSQPTNFPPTNLAGCSESQISLCDSYTWIIQNVGAAASGAEVVFRDTLPAGLTPIAVEGRGGLSCEEVAVAFKCADSEPIAAGAILRVSVYMQLNSGVSGNLVNAATIEEAGGGSKASLTSENKVDAQPSPFAIEAFSFDVHNIEGAADSQAGGHPNSVTTNLFFSTELNEKRAAVAPYAPVEEVKDIVVDLPPGLVGDPQTTARCPESALVGEQFATLCPADSQVGTFVLDTADAFSIHESRGFPVYNMVPEPGYPAEFGFNYQGNPTIMFASASPRTNYGLRVVVPGVARGIEVDGASLTFWGTPADPSHNASRQAPGTEEGGATDSSSPAAFFTNPVNCTSAPLTATVHADSWEHPGTYISATATAYPAITNCSPLAFAPSIGLAPEISQADEPSGYGVEIKRPESASVYPNLTTPELKDATVTFPAGVSVSPAAADGLVGCKAEGSEGINLKGEELGADGQLHAARGHCPAGSILGTVEVVTPLLPSPLKGSMYLAQPKCGGEGQAPCGEADATNGNLFGAYLEVSGSGVNVKLAGKISADPTTGQLKASFAETPQLPFSEFKLHVHGGPRAPLVNPQTCGAFTADSDLTPWSSPTTPDAMPTSIFGIDWDGSGAACPSALPFAPAFNAGMVTPKAAAYSTFTLTLSRGDRQQDLSSISVHTPPGLLGKISEVPLCGEPQAAQGTCAAGSQIGTATAAVGAGSHPFWQSGPVYLTTGYKGAPFGLSIVVPTKAGPFNLGNVVVRAAINVDPTTAALTVTSDALPQILDGVPLRTQTVNVTLARPGFMFNPTNCKQQSINATVVAAQGATAQVASPFAVAGCASLPFTPKFTALTSGKTSKTQGVYLHVRFVSGPGQANIGKIKVNLPKQLPSRLTTLQKACTAAAFNSNPATCPAASLVGTATAHTPVLKAGLTGPAYLVSHGGAEFPDLVIVLQGEGIVLQLDGKTVIKGGITSSTFRVLPDAPVSSFDLILPQGSHSLLAATAALCRTTLGMPTALTGQNGAVLKQTTKIAVMGCPAKKKAKKK
jgi:hypothetical protein